MFSRGDLIFHRHHGLGRVKRVAETVMLGSRQSMVTVSFERSGFELNVAPARLAKYSRDVIARREALGVLEHLSHCDTVLADEYRVRSKNNVARLTSGDPYELCDVIVGLRRMRKKRGHLSQTDEQHLRSATEILSDELAVALDCDDRAELVHELGLVTAS